MYLKSVITPFFSSWQVYLYPFPPQNEHFLSPFVQYRHGFCSLQLPPVPIPPWAGVDPDDDQYPVPLQVVHLTVPLPWQYVHCWLFEALGKDEEPPPELPLPELLLLELPLPELLFFFEELLFFFEELLFLVVRLLLISLRYLDFLLFGAFRVTFFFTSSKAPLPIFFSTVDFIVIVLSFLHPLNAPFPISVTFFPMDTVFSFVHPFIAFFEIVTTL